MLKKTPKQYARTNKFANSTGELYRVISMNGVDPEIWKLIDRMSKVHEVGRGVIAKAVLAKFKDEIPAIATELGKPRVPVERAKRQGYAYCHKKVTKAPEAPINAHDRICAEINGVCPVGGCKYPECKCK
jgi:hypothetical protein